jgi:hypothetical protein
MVGSSGNWMVAAVMSGRISPAARMRETPTEGKSSIAVCMEER